MKYLISFLFLFVSASAFAQTGVWSGDLDIQGVSLGLVFNLDESEVATLDVPDQGAKDIRADVTRNRQGGIKIYMPSLNGGFEGIWLGNQITGTFTQNGSSFPLTLKAGVKKLNRPQTPAAPFPYSEEEVSFKNGNCTFNGTLTLPEASSKSTVALVMVTGSGVQNRDEELFEHKPFAVIADALARAGFASFRYDDRGFTPESGNYADATIEDIAADALAAVDLLRQRFDKVGVLGHSEGGTVAILLAAGGKVDFVVSLAGMIVSGKETLLIQNRYALGKAGIDGKDLESYLSLLSDCFDALTDGTPAPKAADYFLPAALNANFAAASQQLKSPHMISFLKSDVRTSLPLVKCPVLALNGTKDIQVDCSLNLTALEKGLPAVNSIVPVEGVNHLFQNCLTGETDEYKEIEETISPKVLEVIVNFLSLQ